MKRIISIVVSIAVFSMMFACLPITSHASQIQRRGVVLSAPYYEGGGALTEITTQGMKGLFERNGISSTIYVNNARTNTAFLNYIEQALSGSSSSDVNYIYIQSHGSPSGLAVCGLGYGLLSFSQLKSTLDGIPGKKVIYIEACYSGSAIVPLGNVPQGIINNFLGASTSENSVNSGEFANSDYVIFCSSEPDQYSYEYAYNWGMAPIAWANGGGFDHTTNASMNTRLADANNDGIVTVGEYFAYCAPRLRELHDEDTAQDMCYYSPSDYISLFYDDYRLGDVNMDGDINNNDVRLIVTYISSNDGLTSRQFELADMNGDGIVNLVDARVLTNMISNNDVFSYDITE